MQMVLEGSAAIALPLPRRQYFDYDLITPAAIGTRVRVPFQNRELVGVVADAADGRYERKPVLEQLDSEPLWSAQDWQLLRFIADYYHAPLGQVAQLAMPGWLRQGRPADAALATWVRTTNRANGLGPRALARAPKQAAALAKLLASPQPIATLNAQLGDGGRALRALLNKQLVERCWPQGSGEQPAPSLNAEQQQVLTAMTSTAGFVAHLLFGVTGSGKTEVYLRLAQDTLARGEQVLILVPEIGLTPQLQRRIERRLAASLGLLHSMLPDGERYGIWDGARRGEIDVIVGTRSAVLTPLPRLGLIIIDEEHDASFKQADGVRYHARDVAIKRAALIGVPVVLGSATPALETLHNAQSGRFELHHLRQRAGGARPPSVAIIDAMTASDQQPLTQPLVDAIQQVIDRKEQAIIFLNRRGYAPVLFCRDCRSPVKCHRCDANMVVHRNERQLRCHHCGARRLPPQHCESCGSPELIALGSGTQRLEAWLADRWPNVYRSRIDRDTVGQRDALNRALRSLPEGEPALLVGTQMLAKGHHLPRVTLVGIVGLDQSLLTTDFRGPETAAQLLQQVGGRAGRADLAGRVIIQTQFPNHPVLTRAIDHHYEEVADFLLAERRALSLPPVTHAALISAEAKDNKRVEGLLSDLIAHCKRGAAGVEIFGPTPAGLARRAGFYRYQVWYASPQRPPLHATLATATRWLETAKTGGIRWAIDVDPQHV